MSDQQDIIIGIDLGTTNSLVAHADEKGPRLVLPEGSNDPILPSVVSIEGTGTVVGKEARAHEVEKPLTTIHSVKRLMGKGFADLEQDVRTLPYEIDRRPDEHENRDIAVDLSRRFRESHIAGYAASGEIEISWAAVASIHRSGIAGYLGASLAPVLAGPAGTARQIPVNLPG